MAYFKKLQTSLKHMRGGVTFIVLALVIAGIILVNLLLLIDRSTLFSQNTNYSLDEVQAVSMAEAGLDKAISSVNLKNGAYSGVYSFDIGEGKVVTNVEPDLARPGAHIITSTAYIPNQENPRVTRKLSVLAGRVTNLSMPYAVHAGSGGLFMGNNNLVLVGSVLSNGPVLMGSFTDIEGRLTVTEGLTTQPVAETRSCGFPGGQFGGILECVMTIRIGFREPATSTTSFTDRAQDFVPIKEGKLDKVLLVLGKNGSPSPIEVNIVGNDPDTNFPDPSNILAQETLLASQVPATIWGGWIEVKFTDSPTLLAGQKYWIVLDSQIPDNTEETSNYYTWYTSREAIDLYPQGMTYKTNNWPTSAWSVILPPQQPGQSPDGVFKVFLKDIPGGHLGPNWVEGIAQWNDDRISYVAKDIYANTIRAVYTNAHAYYQTVDPSAMIGSVLWPLNGLGGYCPYGPGGAPDPNPYCHPNSPIPSPVPLPITASMLDAWKTEASSGGTINGSGLNCSDLNNVGPKRILGDVTLNFCTGAAAINLNSPIHITGNLTLQDNNILSLDPKYGRSSGIVIVGGKITINSYNRTYGTGAGSSSLIVLSEAEDDNTTTPQAIRVTGTQNGSLFLYASKGSIFATGNNKITKLAAENKVELANISGPGNAIDGGNNFTNLEISSGLDGDFGAVNGTYVQH